MHQAALASVLGTNHAETSQDLHRLPSPTPTQQTTEGGLRYLLCCAHDVLQLQDFSKVQGLSL